MTSGKTVTLTGWTFVSKITSLLFQTLSRFVIAFLPRSKHLLISGLWSPSTVILEPKKIKSVPVSIVSPSICHEVMGVDNSPIKLHWSGTSVNNSLAVLSVQSTVTYSFITVFKFPHETILEKHIFLENHPLL